MQFRNISYYLRPKSISILPDCGKVIFNTAKVTYSFAPLLITYSYISKSAITLTTETCLPALLSFLMIMELINRATAYCKSLFVVYNYIVLYGQVNTSYNKRITRTVQIFDSVDRWEGSKDIIQNFEPTISLQSDTLLEHMNVTKDKSDYLWYTMRYIHVYLKLHFLHIK